MIPDNLFGKFCSIIQYFANRLVRNRCRSQSQKNLRIYNRVVFPSSRTSTAPFHKVISRGEAVNIFPETHFLHITNTFPGAMLLTVVNDCKWLYGMRSSWGWSFIRAKHLRQSQWWGLNKLTSSSKTLTAPKNEISKMICAVQEAVVGVSTLFYGVILNEGVAMEACVEQLVYTPHYVVIYRPLRGWGICLCYN